jgi:hypothetical protein
VSGVVGTDLVFLVVVAAVADSFAQPSTAVVGCYLVAAALVLERMRHYVLFVFTARRYRRVALSATASPPPPLPTSELRPMLVVVIASVVTLVFTHTAAFDDDGRANIAVRYVLPLAWALVCVVNIVFARLYDDRASLRAYIKRFVFRDTDDDVRSVGADPSADIVAWSGVEEPAVSGADTFATLSVLEDGDDDDGRSDVTELLFDGDDTRYSDSRREFIVRAIKR